MEASVDIYGKSVVPYTETRHLKIPFLTLVGNGLRKEIASIKGTKLIVHEAPTDLRTNPELIIANAAKCGNNG
jgi:hypothetical protein